MCGRFSQVKAQQELEHFYGCSIDVPYRPNYNIAPTQQVAVITLNGLELMRWGLIPIWAKDEKIAYSMINARAETIVEKQTYKKPFLKGQRCLVPATGFYEWKKNKEGKKTPFNIFVSDQEIFSMAGLFIDSKDSDGNDIKTFTIITTKPNKLMETIHDRMPVILSKEEETDWLSVAEDPNELIPMLDPFPDSKMDAYEVSADVGNVNNNYPELLEKVHTTSENGS